MAELRDVPGEESAHPAAGDPVVLHWHGDVDIANVSELRAELRESMAAQSPHVCIDLGQVEFLDSIGIGVLLEARGEAIRVGSNLSLMNMPSRIQSLLRATGVAGLFELTTTAELPR